MSKLPNIFHNNGKFVTNNKNTYNTFDNKNITKNDYSIDTNTLINYFNKRITIVLKNGKELTGVLISKRNNQLLLDTQDYININDISYIK